MKHMQLSWFLALFLTTSVCLPSIGNAAEVFVFTAEQNTHIRALTASCAACHGTNGNAVGNSDGSADKSGANAVLAGMDPSDFIEKILGFKDGSRKATVMHHHAKGLTVDEINQLAIYFSRQKRVATAPVKSQILKADHE